MAINILRAMAGTSLEQPVELALGEHQQSPCGLGDDRGRPGLAVEQRQLAEVGPGPSVAICLPLRVTVGLPSTMMKNSIPMRPSSTRTLPAGTSSSSSRARIFRSSEPLQLEKSQMDLRSVA